MAYRTEEEWIKLEKEEIAKLPTFRKLEKAVEHAMKRMTEEDYYSFVFQDAGNGDYVVAGSEYFEVLGNHDFNIVLDAGVIKELVDGEKRRDNHGRETKQEKARVEHGRRSGI